MSASPTFALPACPRCSSRAGGLTQPAWKFGHNTSAKRGRSCYFFVPHCRHAEGFSEPSRIYDEPEEWARVEAAWRMRQAELFSEMTAAWTPTQRERWRAMLESRHYVEGTTAEMDLSAGHSGSTTTQEPTKKEESHA